MDAGSSARSAGLPAGTNDQATRAAANDTRPTMALGFAMRNPLAEFEAGGA